MLFFKEKNSIVSPDWQPFYKMVTRMGGKTVEIWKREFIEKSPGKITEDFILLINSSDTYAGKSDFNGTKKILEMKTMVPVVIFDQWRYRDYHSALEDFWLDLYRTFTEKSYGMERDVVGLLGVRDFDDRLPGIEAIKNAGKNEKNIVLAPWALKTANYLAKRFGTPYEIGYSVEGFPHKIDF